MQYAPVSLPLDVLLTVYPYNISNGGQPTPATESADKLLLLSLGRHVTYFFLPALFFISILPYFPNLSVKFQQERLALNRGGGEYRKSGIFFK